jgi:hypothetical protein
VNSRRHRHRKTFIERVKRRWWLVPVALVSVAAVVVAGVQFGAFGWLTGAIAPIVGGCTEPRPIVVAADPSIATALTDIAAEFDETGGNCTTTEIRSLLSADVAALFATGVAGDLDAWVPDSSAWLDRAATTATSLGPAVPEFEIHDYIASTPVVFATTASQVSDLAETPLAWATLLTGAVSTLLPDPESSAASLAGLAQVKSVSSDEDPRQFAGAMIAMGKTIPQSAEAAFEVVAEATVPTVVVTTEQRVAAHNSSSSDSPVVALYPTDGTVELRYPFVEAIADTQDSATGTFDGANAAAAVASEPATAGAPKDLITAFAAAARSATDVLPVRDSVTLTAVVISRWQESPRPQPMLSPRPTLRSKSRFCARGVFSRFGRDFLS